jgi:hypothetical protein
MSSAELTALCRIDGLQREDITQALWNARTLIKAWAMRSTPHLLPATEYGHWLRAFADYHSFYSTPAWLKYFGVTAEERDLITQAVGEITRGCFLTREQLAEEVARRTGLPEMRTKLRQGWGSLLKPANYSGFLSFGPSQGQNTVFTHPEIPPADASEAFAARKFFTAYGPATLRDFARWLSVRPIRARELMAALGDELAEITIEGTPAWILRKDLRKAQRAEPVPTVRLLPAFDQYVFAAALRSAQLLPKPALHSRIYRNQGWFSPVLLVDGRMEGIWNFARKSTRLEIAIEPFARLLARTRKAAEFEAERIAQYFGKPLELRWL